MTYEEKKAASERPLLLLIEDDLTLSGLLGEHLERSFRVHVATTLRSARNLFASIHFDLVLMDIYMPEGSAVDHIPSFVGNGFTRVVVMTSHPEISTAIRAIGNGAFDYLSKPFELEVLEITLRRALSHSHLEKRACVLQRQRVWTSGLMDLDGKSEVRVRLKMEIKKFAQCGTPVLIRGESGSGKSLVAKILHRESPRGDGPFIEVVCSKLRRDSYRAELFGSEPADSELGKKRIGLVELAQGGTLYFDEIGDLPAEIQEDLLYFLDAGSMRRIGSEGDLDVNVRVLASTQRDLANPSEGFRKDLFYRLNVFSLFLPSLRHCKDDLPHFLEKMISDLCEQLQRKPFSVSRDVFRVFQAYDWPGNFRELRNVLERAAILIENGELNTDILPIDLVDGVTQGCLFNCFCNSKEGHFPSLAELERAYVSLVYLRSAQNKSRTAEMLGITRQTLRQKLSTRV